MEGRRQGTSSLPCKCGSSSVGQIKPPGEDCRYWQGEVQLECPEWLGSQKEPPEERVFRAAESRGAAVSAPRHKASL